MLEQTKGSLPGALFEARLQCPGFLDGRLEPPRYREALRLLLQYPIHRIEQCRHRTLASGFGCVPGREHFVPQEGCEQECRRGRLAVADARVGVGECKLDETLAQWLLQDHIEQRQHAVM